MIGCCSFFRQQISMCLLIFWSRASSLQPEIVKLQLTTWSRFSTVPEISGPASLRSETCVSPGQSNAPRRQGSVKLGKRSVGHVCASGACNVNVLTNATLTQRIKARLIQSQIRNSTFALAKRRFQECLVKPQTLYFHIRHEIERADYQPTKWGIISISN